MSYPLKRARSLLGDAALLLAAAGYAIGWVLTLPGRGIVWLAAKAVDRLDPDEPVSTRRGVWGDKDYTAE
jgi:hypothetical protein